MEEMVRSMLQYKGKPRGLKSEKASLSINYEVSRQVSSRYSQIYQLYPVITVKHVLKGHLYITEKVSLHHIVEFITWRR